MEITNKKHQLFIIILSILPLSIIIGSTISLINVLLVNLVILVILIEERKFFILKNITTKMLFILFLYLILNLLISLNFEYSMARNLGFIRLILLFFAINYLFYYLKWKTVIKVWMIVISILLVDVYIEIYTRSNLAIDQINYNKADLREYASVLTLFNSEYILKEEYGNRIVSFFKDEPVVGAYLLGFSFLLFGYLLNTYKNKKLISILFLLLSVFAVLMTGERSNTIKFFIGIFVIFIFLDHIKFKTKLFFLALFFFLSILIVNQSSYLKNRYINQFYDNFTSQEKFIKFSEKNIYFVIYKSGLEVFKKYPIFGVGNKNYRVETCENNIKKTNKHYLCTTHPHQIYLELLSEHGIIGTTILISIFFILLFKIIKQILISRNYIQICSFAYVLVTFIPILPSGSFFGDFNSTLFWINFSIMFASHKNTNIFTKIG